MVKVNNFENVSEEELEQLKIMLSTGFHNWGLQEYQKFVKAIRKYDLKDIKGISEMIGTKTVEEV